MYRELRLDKTLFTQLEAYYLGWYGFEFKSVSQSEGVELQAACWKSWSHPHQKKQAIDPSDTHSFFPLTGVGTQSPPSLPWKFSAFQIQLKIYIYISQKKSKFTGFWSPYTKQQRWSVCCIMCSCGEDFELHLYNDFFSENSAFTIWS